VCVCAHARMTLGTGMNILFHQINSEVLSHGGVFFKLHWNMFH
jgi:hypothetical protein